MPVTPNARWCGFNLLEMFSYQGQPSPGFRTDDFARIHDWGFNYARLPLDYRFLFHGSDGEEWSEETLRQLDRALSLGEEFGVHVCVNLHHAPGFCINTPRDTWTLWTSSEAQSRNERIWATFARRWDGRPNLSFDLVNEPTGCTMAQYTAFVRDMVEAIRCVDDSRFLVADGFEVGTQVIAGVEDLGIGQSMHCYEPMWVTHHKASWVPALLEYVEPPVWPGPLPNAEAARARFGDGHPARWIVEAYGDGVMDRDWLRAKLQPWFDLSARGGWVHCGEFGVFSTAPRAAQLAWTEDLLILLHEHGMGWSLWNLRGPFGVINSGRPEAEMTRLPSGEWLDEPLLALLQRFRPDPED